MGDELLPEIIEGALCEVAADLTHNLEIKMGVVNAQHPKPKNFTRLKQVPQIGTSMVLACETNAAILNRPKVLFLVTGANIYRSF